MVDSIGLPPRTSMSQEEVKATIYGIMQFELLSDEWIERVLIFKAQIESDQDLRALCKDVLKVCAINFKTVYKFKHLCGHLGFNLVSEWNEIENSDDPINLISDPQNFFVSAASEAPRSFVVSSDDFSEESLKHAQSDLDHFIYLFEKVTCGISILEPRLCDISSLCASYEYKAVNLDNLQDKINKRNYHYFNVCASFKFSSEFSLSENLYRNNSFVLKFKKLLNLEFKAPKNLKGQKLKNWCSKKNKIKENLSFFRAEYINFIEKNHEEAEILYKEIMENTENVIYRDMAKLRYVEHLCDIFPIKRSNDKKKQRAKIAENLIKKHSENIQGFYKLNLAMIYSGRISPDFKNLGEMKKLLIELLAPGIENGLLKEISLAYLGELFLGFYGSESIAHLTPDQAHKIAMGFFEKAMREPTDMIGRFRFTEALLAKNASLTPEEGKQCADLLTENESWNIIYTLYSGKYPLCKNADLAQLYKISSVIEEISTTTAVKLSQDYFNEKKYEEALLLLKNYKRNDFSKELTHNYVIANLQADKNLPTYNPEEAFLYYEKLANYGMGSDLFFKLYKFLQSENDIKFKIKIIKLMENIKKDHVIINNCFKKIISSYVLNLYHDQEDESIKNLIRKSFVDLNLDKYARCHVSASLEQNSNPNLIIEPTEMDNQDVDSVSDEDSGSDSEKDSSAFSEAHILELMEEHKSVENKNNHFVFIDAEMQPILSKLKYYNKLTFHEIKELVAYLGGDVNEDTKTIRLPNCEVFTYHTKHQKKQDNITISFSKRNYWKKWKQMVQDILLEQKIWNSI